MKQYSDYGIIINSNKVTGEVPTICPKCSHTRKKKSDKCLSVNLDKKVWRCNHCGWAGGLPIDGTFTEKKKVYTEPVLIKSNLSDKLIAWFKSRGIFEQTLIDEQINEGITELKDKKTGDYIKANTVQFTYFDFNGTLVNIKYRDGKKNFKLSKGAKKVFLGLNKIDLTKPVWICEGEIDYLSLRQANVNVLSVPNGGVDKGDNNLEYVDNFVDDIIDKYGSIEVFENIPEFIICTDDDSAGRKLYEDLASRLGKERIKRATWVDCKDANEALIKYGLNFVLDVTLKEYPIEGVQSMNDLKNDIWDMYDNGLPKGVAIGHQNFDKLLTFVPGYITGITGIPGHGKSEFVDEITTRLSCIHSWKGAYFSPENKPTKLHISKIARKIVGKKWDGVNKISRSELNQFIEFMDDMIWFISPEENRVIDSILEKAKLLKQRKGIKWLVIDAWNKIEHSDNNTDEIGKTLDKLNRFCFKHDLHCFLVVHPNKQKKNEKNGLLEVPNLYSMSGSAHFYNMLDNGLCVYRDMTDNSVKVFVQKVKFSHWGNIGHSTFTYEADSGRYRELNEIYNDYGNWIHQYAGKSVQIELKSEPSIQANDSFLSGSDIFIGDFNDF